ncbi:16S rRNA processing protein RimM [Pelagirhabdus alkalitolerans]|uniref:Ribosome maturation factor RimM n=1 Tax=Pelagirhabdus alkalitolerans TaxID=1612202 RepID=A0A1G6H3C7_9BACI|nr:ribosome maturation factor RimM [Pelagirhabdus alkalitolerans]SDB88405.1 16S rRNA processing protein RimM [Pelagirhabdus alkalitolerans]
MTHYYNVGKIVNTHGIKGEVKVVRITDFEDRFTPGNRLYLFSNDTSEPIELTIKHHRVHKGFDMLSFEGYESINEVEPLKDSLLKIHQSEQSELEEHSYYYHQIIGCDVQTIDQEHIGTVSDVLSPGANDVWVVKPAKGKDILIPYIEDVVIEVDLEKQLITIDPIEGLLS